MDAVDQLLESLAVHPKTTHTDGFAVVPRFDKEHDVDQLIAADFQQVVELVAE